MALGYTVIMKRLILILLLLPFAAAAGAAGQRTGGNSKQLTTDAVRSKAAPIDVLRDDVEELKGRMEAQDKEIGNLRTQIRKLEAKVAETQAAASQHSSEDARADLQ
jgi:hypothetical protein